MTKPDLKIDRTSFYDILRVISIKFRRLIPLIKL
jgi:hypothetical protein